MKKILLIIIVGVFTLLSAYSQKVHLKGLNATDHISIKDMFGAAIVDMPGSASLIWDYSGRTLGEKVRIRKVLQSGEYIERIYTLVAGDDNVLYLVILGFFETDRKELDSIVVRASRRIERKDGSMTEIKAWIIKAVKDLQRID